MGAFGAIELTLDKVYNFKVNTAQATVLLHLESLTKGISNKTLAEYINIEESVLK